MSSMQTYLAAKYMSGPKADAILNRSGIKRKKKRREEQAPETSIIVDDVDTWGEEDKDKDVEEDVVVASDRSFRKKADSRETGWSTIREPSPPPPVDEQPTVVINDSNIFKGGLMTAEQMKARFSKRDASTRKQSPPTQEEETVYRDASGRRIDTNAERAEAARKKREREEREAKKMEWGKGVVQREEEERKQALLALEATRDLARYADDAVLNEMQKAEQRWNDPAAAFLTTGLKKGPRRPEYSGPPPPPNRFGIKPGYRWDGVDRGNGFEKKLFQNSNSRSRHAAASHSWSVEDM